MEEIKDISEEYDNLIVKLQLILTRDIHSKNKAIFYLREWKEKKKYAYEKLRKLCFIAIEKNDFTQVGEFLRGMW